MSKYLPKAVSADDLEIGKEPYFGGEFQVFLTKVPAILVGVVAFSAADTATYTPNAGAVIAAAADIQLAALGELESDEPCAVQLTGTNNLTNPTTGLAVFTPPAWSANQTGDFSRGYAKELVPLAGAQFTAITGLSAVTGGKAGLKVGVFVLPNLDTDFTEIGCTTEIDFNDKSRMPKGVNCRMQTDAFIKAGMTSAGELNISGKLFSPGDGLARFSGRRVTAMLVGLKDGQLIGDRLVFTNARLNLKTRLPDGEGEATFEGTGKFEEYLAFVAP